MAARKARKKVGRQKLQKARGGTGIPTITRTEARAGTSITIEWPGHRGGSKSKHPQGMLITVGEGSPGFVR